MLWSRWRCHGGHGGANGLRDVGVGGDGVVADVVGAVELVKRSRAEEGSHVRGVRSSVPARLGLSIEGFQDTSVPCVTVS